MSRSRPRAPAMTDVASLAGVSHQTVSRVLNNHPNVREQTRLRVQAAMSQLGYRPNRAAKALVTGRSQAVGIVAQSTPLYGPTSILTAVDRAISAAGLSVTIASVPVLDHRSISGAVERLMNQAVDGIVVIAPVSSANEALDELPVDLPLVSIDGDATRSTPLVTVDQHLGARLATEYLLEVGHETVWHVAGPEEWFDAADRVAGWRAALAAAEVEAPPIIQADWTLASGYRAGQMLARISDARAVFAANDHLALGIMKALRESGRRTPDDVSVIGFDDIPEAAYVWPALTTVRPDFDQVASRTVALLLEQLDGEHGRLPSEKPQQPIPPELVVRDSVRAAG